MNVGNLETCPTCDSGVSGGTIKLHAEISRLRDRNKKLKARSAGQSQKIAKLQEQTEALRALEARVQRLEILARAVTETDTTGKEGT